MGNVIPLGDERVDLGGEVIEVGEVGSAESLPAQNGKPLLDLIHPGTVYGSEVHDETRMSLQPRASELALVDADVVADDMNRLHLLRCVFVDRFE